MSKRMTMTEAIARYVPDGTSIALGLALEPLIPYAAGFEIIRQQKRHLTLIGPISDILFDQLIGAGCVEKVRAAWVGNVSEGLGHCYRRAVEQSIPRPVHVEEYSNYSIGLALWAAGPWRQRVGLPRGGPSALITTLAIFTFDLSTGEALLQSYHPGTSIEQVQEQTGWPLRLAPNCAEKQPPEDNELRLIRECDPQGVWTQ